MSKAIATRCTFILAFLLASLFSGLSHLLQQTNDQLVNSTLSDNKLGKVDNNKDEHVPVCADPCIWKAGIDGSWVQDFDFARDYGQYDTPRAIADGPYGKRTAGAHVPSKDAPFPWRTSWKWVDQECPVDVMTYVGICHILKRLNIRRLLFYGDSLTEQHYSSFVNQMNSTNFDKAKGVLTCQEPGDAIPYTIRIFHERDHGGNASPRSRRGVFRLKNSTNEFFQETNMVRVLGVFNIDAHYHNWTHYMEDMDTMVGTLEELNRTQDVYFFRSTSPGHDGCQPTSRKFDWKAGTRLRPLTNFSEYKSRHKFDWDQFEGYNNYTKHLLLKRNRLGIQPEIHFLDIYNMTALRSDAHTAPADCLHFQSPGPVDWWNHLLYTYLNRIANHDAGWGHHRGNCRVT